MVKHYSVVVDAHFQIWITQIVDCDLRESFPVSDGIIGNVPNSSTSQSEFSVADFLVAKAFLDWQAKGLRLFSVVS